MAEFPEMRIKRGVSGNPQNSGNDNKKNNKQPEKDGNRIFPDMIFQKKRPVIPVLKCLRNSAGL